MARSEGEPLWRCWVDTKRRVVSFHETEGGKLLEFRSRETFLICIDRYTKERFRFQ